MRRPAAGWWVAGLVVAAGVAVALASCRRPQGGGATPVDPPPPPGWFTDVTDTSGLHFVNDPGPTGTYFMPQSMGSGAGCLDFDGDGLLDFYLVNFGGPKSASVNRLFRQSSPGKFEDVTAGSGLGIAGHCHGLA